jgi:hypothetical protein
MNVGITILYSATKEKNLLGVLKSYVVECNDKYSVIELAHERAKEQIKSIHPGYKFIGIEDVFTVTGKIQEGELMGRSTLFDIESLDKARELVNDNIDFTIEKNNKYNY